MEEEPEPTSSRKLVRVGHSADPQGSMHSNSRETREKRQPDHADREPEENESKRARGGHSEDEEENMDVGEVQVQKPTLAEVYSPPRVSQIAKQ